MRHNHIEQLIEKSFDQGLNSEEKQLLNTHLSGCPECQTYYNDLVAINQGLLNLIEFYPGHEFNERVVRALGIRHGFARSRIGIGAFVLWLVSLIFCLIIPWPGRLLNQLLIKSPEIFSVYENISLAINAMLNLIKPYIHSLFNPGYFISGIIMSMLLFYILSKIIKEEAECSL